MTTCWLVTWPFVHVVGDPELLPELPPELLLPDPEPEPEPDVPELPPEPPELLPEPPCKPEELPLPDVLVPAFPPELLSELPELPEELPPEVVAPELPSSDGPDCDVGDDEPPQAPAAAAIASREAVTRPVRQTTTGDTVAACVRKVVCHWFGARLAGQPSGNVAVVAFGGSSCDPTPLRDVHRHDQRRGQG
jgi:hypothetical protein